MTKILNSTGVLSKNAEQHQLTIVMFTWKAVFGDFGHGETHRRVDLLGTGAVVDRHGDFGWAQHHTCVYRYNGTGPACHKTMFQSQSNHAAVTQNVHAGV